MISNTTNNHGLRVTLLRDTASFPKWSCTVRLALHEHGRVKYIYTDFTAISLAVDKHNLVVTSDLLTNLDVPPADGEKSSASTKGKGKAMSDAALKMARNVCKGRRKTFIFLCSTITLELLEDVMGMSESCPFALWTAINHRYGINNTARQAARCDLGKPDVYLVRPGDTVCSIWAHIQALVSVLATETKGHKMSEHSRLVILATALKAINPCFDTQFNTLANNTPTESVLKALDWVEASCAADVAPRMDTVLYGSYRRLMGALLYIALATHPNILHAIVYLSRFVHVYNDTHYNAAQHVLRYLYSTAQLTIHYSQHTNNSTVPLIHCDSSHATNLLTMKSYSGTITLWAGGPIAWSSQLQCTVTLSTTEAKLVAVTDASCQALYLQRLLPALGFSLDQPILMFNDNQSTLDVIHKPVYTYPKRLQHVSIKHAFVNDHIERDIAVCYIPGDENLADFLTKHIPGPKLRRDRAALNMFARD